MSALVSATTSCRSLPGFTSDSVLATFGSSLRTSFSAASFAFSVASRSIVVRMT